MKYNRQLRRFTMTQQTRQKPNSRFRSTFGSTVYRSNYLSRKQLFQDGIIPKLWQKGAFSLPIIPARELFQPGAISQNQHLAGWGDKSTLLDNMCDFHTSTVEIESIYAAVAAHAKTTMVFYSSGTLVGSTLWDRENVLSKTATVSAHGVAPYMGMAGEHEIPLEDHEIDEFEAQNGDESIHELRTVSVRAWNGKTSTDNLETRSYDDMRYLKLDKAIPKTSFMYVDNRSTKEIRENATHLVMCGVNNASKSEFYDGSEWPKFLTRMIWGDEREHVFSCLSKEKIPVMYNNNYFKYRSAQYGTKDHKERAKNVEKLENYRNKSDGNIYDLFRPIDDSTYFCYLSNLESHSGSGISFDQSSVACVLSSDNKWPSRKQQLLELNKFSFFRKWIAIIKFKLKLSVDKDVVTSTVLVRINPQDAHKLFADPSSHVKKFPVQ